jgi:transposase
VAVGHGEYTVAYFDVHPKTSNEAFGALIEDWVGILVSDGYAVYERWVELTQTCLTHLIRQTRGLSEGKNQEIRAFGRRALAELKRLCSVARAPPIIVGEWRAFYARLSHLISRNHDREDEEGTFARRLLSD